VGDLDSGRCGAAAADTAAHHRHTLTSSANEVKAMRSIFFLALLFAALALVPSGAHLAELANKMRLSGAEYQIVQQIYRGWALFGIIVAGALASALALTIALRHHRTAFKPALVALLCIVGTQVVFWTFTFPVNQTTVNWTVLPSNWHELRVRWEYSHAASAGLNLAAVTTSLVPYTTSTASESSPMRSTVRLRRSSRPTRKIPVTTIPAAAANVADRSNSASNRPPRWMASAGRNSATSRQLVPRMFDTAIWRFPHRTAPSDVLSSGSEVLAATSATPTNWRRGRLFG
jgi:hypothetical protein